MKDVNAKEMSEFNVRVIFDRRNETINDPTKLAPVHIEIRKIGDSKRKLVHTNVKLLRSQYSFENGKGVKIKNHVNSLIYRTKIMNKYNAIESFVMSGKCKTWEDVDRWDKTDEQMLQTQYGSFIKFYETQMAKHATTKWVMQNWQSLLTRLEEFQKIVLFDDLTYANIKSLLSFEGITYK